MENSYHQKQAKKGKRIGKRKHSHDYCAPWKYHITLSKTDACPDFSKLSIIELNPEGVGLTFSPLGLLIYNSINEFQSTSIRIYRHSIMPDHIHLLVHVKESLPKHLGYYLAEFKSRVTTQWRELCNDDSLEVFESNYHDRIILPEHSLNDVFQYIRMNPYRLAVHRYRPDFFRKTRAHFIGDREMQAYGNLFHLRNPFKYSLVIHRADDDRTVRQKLEDCLYHAANGGVVVSAFISPKEKEIRREIEAAGGRIILIQNRPFGDRDKPAKHDFELCEEGRLLILSPLDYLTLPKTDHPSRRQCLDMNSLAEQLAAASPEKLI